MNRASHGIYLDSAAGAPLHPRVVTGFMDALRSFSGSVDLLPNPNSTHQPGQRMQKLIRETSELILQSLGLSSKDYSVLFTSSATEAVQTATRSVLLSREPSLTWWVSGVEHACNRDLMPEMEKRGVTVIPFPVNDAGETPWETLSLQKGQPGLLTLISVQNESGITSHILRAAKFARENQLALCIDHVAGWGKVDLPFAEAAPDFVALSGHKIGAFPGIGVLVSRKTTRVEPMIPGSQQGRMRGGTENTAGILSLKLALEGRRDDVGNVERVRALRDRFEAELLNEFARARVNGREAQRSPYISSVTFGGQSKPLDLPLKLDLRGISVSSGSACQSAVPKPSFVLLHYGMDELDARNTIRVSLHDQSRWEDLAGLLAALRELL